jgi:hypothetical protein
MILADDTEIMGMPLSTLMWAGLAIVVLLVAAGAWMGRR